MPIDLIDGKWVIIAAPNTGKPKVVTGVRNVTRGRYVTGSFFVISGSKAG